MMTFLFGRWSSQAVDKTAYNFSAMRNFALLARGFALISFSPGTIGFLVTSFSVALWPQVQMGCLEELFHDAIFQRVEGYHR
jgi:hypothetical protein